MLRRVGGWDRGRAEDAAAARSRNRRGDRQAERRSLAHQGGHMAAVGFWGQSAGPLVAVGPGAPAIRSAVVKNLGGLRACVACSNAKAMLISLASCWAPPKKEIPSGSPKT